MASISALDNFRRHVERFGSESVLQVAGRELQPGELAELCAFVESMERTHRFERGAWVERPAKVRACAHCGRDLPRDGQSDRRFHPHCREAAKKARQRARRASEGTGQGSRARGGTPTVTRTAQGLSDGAETSTAAPEALERAA